MKELSVTVTVGTGSEKHNHDLEYRDTLQHVHSRPDGVIELVPYRSYQEQINEALRPYIDEYNEKQQARYHAAWERYNAGQIKTKPRKRDYKPMSYDYVQEHLHDQQRNPHTGKLEDVPMYREVILGIGDRADRREGRVSEEQAKAIFAAVVEQFEKDFPNFKLLGATLHLDEEGFYHCHIDYKPMYKKDNPDRGLAVGFGQDSALEQMGFEPEQSLINGRDKVPILFNAFRNRLYTRMEEAMAAQELRLQYGVSQTKEPGKDSTRKQSLDTWQATQDAARDLQHQKNVALDILANDEVSPEGLKTALEAVQGVEASLKAVEGSPKTILRDGYKITFNLFSQLKSLVQGLKETIGHLIHRIDVLTHNCDYYAAKAEEADKLSSELSKAEKKYAQSVKERSDLSYDNAQLRRSNQVLKAQMDAARETMKATERIAGDNPYLRQILDNYYRECDRLGARPQDKDHTR